MCVRIYSVLELQFADIFVIVFDKKYIIFVD